MKIILANNDTKIELKFRAGINGKPVYSERMFSKAGQAPHSVKKLLHDSVLT